MTTKLSAEDIMKNWDTFISNIDTYISEPRRSKLKEFYNIKINDFKSDLIKLNKKTANPVTKIKINEVLSLIKPLDKNHRVNDDDLVNLLQYCDLLTELETVNA